MIHPPGTKFLTFCYLSKLALLEYFIPGHSSGCGGFDKGKNGHRVDSIPIANSVIKAGGACDLLLYDSSGATAEENTANFDKAASKYDALIVRINPGQLAADLAANGTAVAGLETNCTRVDATGSARFEGREGGWLPARE